ncbi:MAG: hypothetical protein JNM17_33950 [Archangium sp.]|nr:hypothetical protein [Archangium sp.]
MTISILATVALLMWAAVCVRQRNKATAAGALAMAAVTGAGMLAQQLDVAFWVEGGPMMPWLALSGGYAIGTAVASRLTPLATSHPARLAAIVSAIFTVGLAGFLYRSEMATVEEFVKNASPDDAAIILQGTRGEVLKLVEFAAAMSALAMAIVFTPGSKGRRRSVDSLPQHDRVAA